MVYVGDAHRDRFLDEQWDEVEDEVEDEEEGVASERGNMANQVQPLSFGECQAIRQHLDDSEPEIWSGYHLVRLDRATVYRLLATIDSLRELAMVLAEAGDDPGPCKLCQAVEGTPHAPGCLSERALPLVR